MESRKKDIEMVESVQYIRVCYFELKNLGIIWKMITHEYNGSWQFLLKEKWIQAEEFGDFMKSVSCYIPSKS